MENTLSFNGDFYFSLVSPRKVREHDFGQNKEIFTDWRLAKVYQFFLIWIGKVLPNILYKQGGEHKDYYRNKLKICQPGNFQFGKLQFPWETIIQTQTNSPSLKMVNIYYNNWGDRSIRERKKIVFFIWAAWQVAETEGGLPSPCSSNSWCELSMIDDGETGQFTNCYWEYLSYLHTNNPGPRQTRYLHFQQKLLPPWKVLQSGWWSEGGRGLEKIKDVFMQKTKI